MSDKSKNSSKESTLQDSNKEKQYFKNILICKCGNFHEFYIFFEKEHYIVFPCCSVKLSELNQSEEVSEKCSFCKDKISIDRDYFIKAHKNTSFVCESCKKKKGCQAPLKVITNPSGHHPYHLHRPSRQDLYGRRSHTCLFRQPSSVPSPPRSDQRSDA